MQPPAPLLLQDALKHYSHDQEKVIPPAETVRRFLADASSSGLNILREVVRIDSGRLDIPVYFSLCGDDAIAAIGNKKQMGKGATPEQAQASAVMELAERFSLFSFRRNAGNFQFTTARSLAGPKISFEAIQRSVTDESADADKVRPFFEDLPLYWTWAHDLTHGEVLQLPFDWFYAINEFNGASAGNCIEEALCQGICEVVERHVCALISRQKKAVPGISVDSVDDAAVRELLAKYQKAGIELFLSDFTLAMGIPTVAVLAWDPATFPRAGEIVWTAGTTPSPAKALCRALTEVAQLAGDFISSGKYVASGLPKPHHLDEVRFVTRPASRIPLSRLPDLGHENIKIEIEGCLAALADRGFDVLSIDLRHPALKIPAFYTMMPGAHFRERAIAPSVAMICAKLAGENLPHGKALAALQRLNKLVPERYFIHFYIGRLHQQVDDHAAALNHFKRAGELSPPAEDLAAVHTYAGMSYKDSGDYAQALEVLGQAEAIDPERTDTLNLMGFCHFKQKAYAEAVACFQRIIALNPNSAIDYANLAVNYRALGERERAIANYRRALSIDPEIEFARQHLQEMTAP